MKLRQSGLQLLVGRRDAFMLALMLEPGGDQKRLDHAGGFGRVLIDVPVVGAVAQALGFERMQRGKKRLTILRPDFVFDDDLHRAAIGLHLVGHDRRRPMHRGREIDRGAGLQLPAREQRDRGQRAGRGKKMCNRQARQLGELTPKRAAERHGAEQDGGENREAPPLHPDRQGDLSGDVERRQNGDP